MSIHEIARPFQRWVFVSYAHRDQYWRDRLRSHLTPLEKLCGAEVFTDAVIDTGEDWDKQIKQCLHDANAAVLLISADFLASRYIADNEFPALLARTMEERSDLRVFPVFVSSCCYDEVTFEYTSPRGRRETRLLSSVMGANDPATPLAGQTTSQQEETLANVARRIAVWFRELDHAPVGPKPMLPRIAEHADVSRMPRSFSVFKGREDEVKALERCFRDERCAVCTIVARGGEGKSALVSHWLRQLEGRGWQGARAFAWSFYSQGTREVSAAADDFIFEALTFFGDPPPHQGPPETKGKRLAELLNEEKTVLVLDGLEPLQDSCGHIEDTALAALLTTLATHPAPNGLCIITTRQPVANFNTAKILVGETPPVKPIRLEPLSPEAGARLLRLLGVPGSQRVLGHLCSEVHGHPLSLMIMGTYVRDAGLSLLTEEVEGLPPIEISMPAHAHLRIMQYERYFDNQPHRDVLRILGLFDRPVSLGEIVALKRAKIKQLTTGIADLTPEELQAVMDRLRRAGLINEPSIENWGGLDAHPLIREYFAVRLRTLGGDAWRQGHKALYEYLRPNQGTPPPRTLSEMIPFYQAMHHAALGGCLQEALKELYWKHIQRGPKGYSHRQFGAFQTELNMLRDCFDQPWTEPKPELSPFWRAHVLGSAGSRLRALGKLREAAAPLRKSMMLHRACGHTLYATVRARHLCELHLELGKLKEAVEFGEEAVRLADLISEGENREEYDKAGVGEVDNDGARYERLVAHTVLGAAQHQQGDMHGAKRSFEQACLIAKEPGWGTIKSAFGLWGFRYCEYLIDAVTSAADEAHRASLLSTLQEQLLAMDAILRADIDQFVPEGDLGLLGKTLAELVTIRAECLKPGFRPNHYLVKRARLVAEELRKGKRKDFIPLGIINYVQLARRYAQALQKSDQPEKASKFIEYAKRELDNARKIAKSGGMLLYQVDCLIEGGWLHHVEGRRAKARKRYLKARRLVKGLRYGRRMRDLRELGVALK